MRSLSLLSYIIHHMKTCVSFATNLELNIFSVIFISVFMPQIVNTKPLESSTGIVSSETFSSAMDFLVRFGYLSQSDKNNADLRSEDHLSEAISTMQRFGGLPPTGRIDNQTLALMRKKRCGVPDILNRSDARVKRYALQGSKWERTDLTWRVENRPKLDMDIVLRELTKAFKVWSDVSKLRFELTQRSDADIIIAFLKRDHGCPYSFDGPGIVLAHAFYPGPGMGGDAHFDNDEDWKQGKTADGGPNLYAVAAHEFGHSLGLAHSPVLGSLMFPYYTIMKDDFVLPNDDTVGIQELYGAKNMPSQTDRKTRKTAIYPTRPSTDTPELCFANFDAIASIRGQIFIFKDKYFWWLYNNKTFERLNPTQIHDYWLGLPNDVKIDAVYERKDSIVVFFIGKNYWIYFTTNRTAISRPLTHLGLPHNLEKIDAAMIWGHNEKTYLFSGSLYWRYDERDDRVDLDYPRDMSVWKGIPYNIDSAFQWTFNKETYFFKDEKFWKFDDKRMGVSEDSPQLTNDYWFKILRCTNTISPPFNGIDTSANYYFNFGIHIILFKSIFLDLKYNL